MFDLLASNIILPLCFYHCRILILFPDDLKSILFISFDFYWDYKSESPLLQKRFACSKENKEVSSYRGPWIVAYILSHTEQLREGNDETADKAAAV